MPLPDNIDVSSGPGGTQPPGGDPAPDPADSDTATPDLAPPAGRTPEAAEGELWTGRTSWKHYAGRVSLWFLANVAVALGLAWAAGRSEGFTATHVMGIVTGLVVVTGVAVLGRIAFRIWGLRYRLTSQRLFISKGIISQTIDQTELVRVDDVRIHKTLIDRIFGLGTVGIVSTDSTDGEVTIEGIPAADQVAEAVRAQMRLARKRSLYVENI